MDVTDLRFSEEPLLAENKSPRSEDPMVVYEEMTQDDEIEAAVMICLDNLNGPIDCCALEPDGLEDAVARRFGLKYPLQDVWRVINLLDERGAVEITRWQGEMLVLLTHGPVEYKTAYSIRLSLVR